LAIKSEKATARAPDNSIAAENIAPYFVIFISYL
jgi:hypothetical protein